MARTLTRRRLIIAALLSAGLQTGVLATMISANATIVSEGMAVLLKTVPVDPRDLLRGEYVVLGYEFSALDAALVEGEWPVDPGQQRLWVELAPGDDGFWHPLRAAFFPIDPAAGNAVLQSQPFDYQPADTRPSTIRADYGLERYYLPEGKGKALEEARNNGQVRVEARVLPDGTARVADVEVLPEGSE